MCAAIWSMPPGGLAAFPIRFLVRFLDNHGMNTVNARPLWCTVAGGSATYVRALTSPFAERIRTASAVRRVSRLPDGRVAIATDHDRLEYDQVILAVHSDQALAMLAEPDAAERELLAAVPYQANQVVLHRDIAAMPHRRRAWAAWNVRTGAADAPAAVTYWSNRLQNLPTTTPFLVSLNQEVAEDSVLGRWTYHHPRFGPATVAMQARHGELIQRRGISYCGAWWRFGFHEDGVVSALAVCERFGVRP
jgi:predicted NAD/FAD-binding protein